MIHEVEGAIWLLSMSRFIQPCQSFSVGREREPNSMALGRKHNKQPTTDHPKPNRQRSEHLLTLLRRRRVKATHHIVIKQCNRRKHEQRHHPMHEIYTLELILGRSFRRKTRRSIDNPQPVHCGKPIAHIPILVPETIREARQNARQAAERHEPCRHGPRDRIAAALVGEYRG